jgi:hypothetical protein
VVYFRLSVSDVSVGSWVVISVEHLVCNSDVFVFVYPLLGSFPVIVLPLIVLPPDESLLAEADSCSTGVSVNLDSEGLRFVI